MTFKKTSLLTFLTLGLWCSSSLLAMDLPEPRKNLTPPKKSLTPKKTQESKNIDQKNVVDDKNKNKVTKNLKSFNLTDQDIGKVWGDFTALMSMQGPLKPLTLASKDPFFIALGLWRIHQEREALQTNKPPLTFNAFLSCLLAKELSIKNNPILPVDAQLFTKLIHFNPYFTTLEFFNAGITDQHLKKMGIMAHLQELSLEENEITDKGVETLLTYPKLEKLNLAKNKITPKGAVLLAKSPRLLHLNLYKNSIGDEGAEALSLNTILTYLDLREADISDKGAIALAKNNNALTDLRLRYNNITDTGAKAYLTCKHLTHLELSRNQVSDELVKFLEDYLMHSNKFLNTSRIPKRLSVSSLIPQKSRVRILSIDGGGIRGILPAGLLKYIEDNITQRTSSQFYFAQHIDLMAGTSTGGIISLGLTMPGERGRPKYTNQTLLDLYANKGKEIFPAPWLKSIKELTMAPYSPKNLEKHLEEYFEEVYISESVCPTLITSFDLKNNKAHIFDSVKAKKNDKKNFQLKGIGRATSAAPTYFPAARIKNKLQEEFDFVDGGIYANNPTLLALERAQELYPQAQEYVVYSLGTGQVDKKDISSLGKSGLLEWGVNITGVLMKNAAEYTDQLLSKKISKDSRIKYIRIQPTIKDSVKEMDNVKSDNIKDLLQTAQDTVDKEKQTLEMIIEDFLKDFQKK